LLSPADMLIIGAVALIAFGPDQLPKVARRAGQVMRDVQNTSQGFIREMERAADDLDVTREPHTAYESHPSYVDEETRFRSHDAFDSEVPPSSPAAKNANESGKAAFAHEESSGI